MRSLALLAILCGVLLLATDAQGSIDLKHLWSSAVAIGKGLAKDVPRLLPSLRSVLDVSKQVVAGYPYAMASSLINFLCSEVIGLRSIHSQVSPDIRAMHFQLHTPCGKWQYPLLEADRMLTDRHFDASKRLVVLATGWLTTVNDTRTIDAFANAYNCRGDVNLLIVDAASFVDTLYTWSALNTDEIGFDIARGLALLTVKVPEQNIHLIGHSLGAHIVGAAGRYYQEITGKRLARITGLDPAKPCFNEGEHLTGLQRGDADFIDVIHSNPGVLGKREPMGDVDFYPGGLAPLPAGCFSVICAHTRAWKYYAETVYPGNEQNFMATRCNSLKSVREKKCSSRRYAMGYATPMELRGSYFLEVRGSRPYGMNAKTKEEAKGPQCSAVLCEV